MGAIMVKGRRKVIWDGNSWREGQNRRMMGAVKRSILLPQSKWAPAGERAVIMTGHAREPGDNFCHRALWALVPGDCPKIAYANGVAGTIQWMLTKYPTQVGDFFG